MSKTLAYFRDATRGLLQDNDPDDQRWNDPELHAHILRVLEDISAIVPVEKKTALTAVAKSRELDISSLQDRLGVWRAEYKLGSYRNCTVWGDTLTLDIGFDMTATSEGTLTGTVTFADGSTAITGAGTAFDTELSVGKFIRKSGGTEWYKVAAIATATGLTLTTASNDTGDDTLNKTLYGSQPVYIYWFQKHQITESGSTITPKLERLVAIGAAGCAAIAWAEKHINEVMVGGQTSPREMLTWGQLKKLEFMAELQKERKIRVREKY